MVEIAVQPCVPRLVKWGKLPVLDEWPNTVIPGEPPELLVVISLVAGQYRDGRCVPFHYLWCNLRIVFSCRRYVNVENSIDRCVNQHRRLQLLDGEIRSLRVVS